MLDGEEFSEEMAAAEPNFTRKKGKNKNNKRRFSDEQIKSLESMFESETRLEPRKKLQVARELGLQPRQVAIWFQNKRARWKSKQLEHDYNILQANYNTLASNYEALKKEKQALAIQLQKLKDSIKKPKEEGQCCDQVNTMNCCETTTVKSDSEGQVSVSMGRSEHALGVLSDDDSGIKTDYFGLEDEPNLMSMMDTADGCLSSPEDWRSFDSDGLFDQSNCGYPWWDFWS